MLRDLLRSRLEKGPILKRLKEEFFKAAMQLLDADEFLVAFRKDLEGMKHYVLIVSPFLNRFAVEKFCNLKEVQKAIEDGKRVVVVTRPSNTGEVEKPDEHRECIEMLEKAGVKVVEKSRFHFKAVIIDDSTIYIGSINPLQIVTLRYVPADYMMRFVSEAFVDEVLEKFMPDHQEWLK
uniref:PLD phosphodiesterase domain-containing protein n=2 Tax=Archaeoglobaceae TaxID=2232 RepID=A0A7C4S5I5_9EURY